MQEEDFDLIRPYNNEEIQEAVHRIVSDSAYKPMMNFLFNENQQKVLSNNILKAKTVTDFQNNFTLPCIEAILNKTTDGTSCSRIENINDQESYLFIANHRDIALDSSILGLHLLRNEITPAAGVWGSNLEVSQFIVDLGKSNQQITVYRDGSPKEILKNSKTLSAYINKLISSNERSVWIAQSKGRTKDGRDHVDASILKMLTLSGDRNIKKALLNLNIIPVTISYELEPCGGMKVKEVFVSQQEKYVKETNEDLNSILGGFIMNKGRVHVDIGKPINDFILGLDDQQTNNEIINKVAENIDLQTHKNYKLWPTNYLAYDLLENSNRFEETYNEKTKEDLESRCQMVFEAIDDDKEELRRLFYLMYANPVYSKIKVGSL
jgi:hypothetical protein